MSEFSRGSGRRRLHELRAKRSDVNLADELSRSRTTTIVNMSIELASGLLLILGMVYMFCYCAMQRYDTPPTVYNIFIGTLIIFSMGWGFFFVYRIRRGVMRLRQIRREVREHKSGQGSSPNTSLPV